MNHLLRRLGAMLYDALIICGILMLATAIIIPFNHQLAISPHNTHYKIYLIFVVYGYFAVSWIIGKQTIGMRAWRLTISAADGGPISIKQSLIRFTSAILSLLVLGLGFVWCWHDRISQTHITLRDEPSKKPRP